MTRRAVFAAAAFAACAWVASPGQKPAPARRLSPDSADMAELARCDGRTPAESVARVIDRLGRTRREEAGLAEALVRLASDRSPLFEDRDKYEVTRLRAFTLATLARVGVPSGGLPLLADQLSNGDNPHTVAAAARAVGTLGPRAAWAVPHLARAIDVNAADESLSLERYDQTAIPLQSRTTMRLEAVRALARIGPPAGAALPALRRLSDGDTTAGPVPPDLREAARNALDSIQTPTR